MCRGVPNDLVTPRGRDDLVELSQYASCKGDDILCLSSDVAFAFNPAGKFKVGRFDLVQVALLVFRHVCGRIQLAYITLLLVVELDGLTILERDDLLHDDADRNIDTCVALTLCVGCRTSERRCTHAHEHGHQNCD